MTPQRLKHLSLAQILALSAPAMLVAGFQIPMTVFAPAFLTQHVGLSLVAVGHIMLLARLWDMINDPIMGLLTDSTQTPIGRRRPWVLAGAPIIALATWQLYFAAPGASFATILAWSIALNTAWTMVIVAHGAWGVEISSDYDERSRIFGFKMLAVAGALPIFAIGPAILERRSGAGLAEQMQLMGTLVIVALPLAIGWLMAVVPEPPARRSRFDLKSLVDSYLVVFRRRDFAIISGAYFLVGMGDAIGSSIYLFLVRDGLGLPDWAATFLVVQALFGFVSIPLWLTVSRRTDKRRALIGVLLGQMLLAPVPLFLPVGEVGAFAGFIVAKGLIWGAEYMLLRAIVSDLVDVDAEATGEHRAGVFYASFNLTFGLAGALGGAGALWVLGHLGFDPQADAATRAAFSQILRWMAAAPPLVCAGLCLVLLHSFAARRAPVARVIAPSL